MIDNLLAGTLLFVLPAWALWKSLRRPHADQSRMRRYLKTGLLILALLCLLITDWMHAQRSLTSLGLDVPLTRGGKIGLLIVLAGLSLAIVLGVLGRFRARQPRRVARRREGARDSILPRTRRELIAFLPVGVLLGAGWELLYRGFMIGFLVPRVGTATAVCMASLAYAAAHGYNSRRQFTASTISAGVFTIAFVLTGSLWWLMIVHVSMALAGAVSSVRMTSGQVKVPCDKRVSDSISPHGDEGR